MTDIEQPTSSDDVYLAPARAYCVEAFVYDGPYVSDEARAAHLGNDAASQAEYLPFRAAVDAARAAVLAEMAAARSEMVAVLRAAVSELEGKDDAIAAGVRLALDLIKHIEVTP